MTRFRFVIVCVTLIVTAVAVQPLPAQGEWRQRRSRHFEIYYKDVPDDFIDSVEESAEKYYEDITRDLGFTRYQNWSYDNRATIYIYNDREDYIKNARQKGWSHGAAFARLKMIHTFPSAHGFFDSTLPHELGHIIFREFIGYDTAVPLWLEEGVAMFQEKGKRWGATKYVKEAMESGRFLTLHHLSGMRLYGNSDRQLVDLFYAESASIVYYLMVEQGEMRFVRFCRKLRQGQPFESALRSAYSRFRDLEDLNRNWMKYIKDQ